ncbi:MAG: murein transglycosylase A [Pseudolabrys sp.]
MARRRLRKIALGGVAATGVLAATAVAAHARDGLRISGAQAEPLTFAALEGWADDDHAAAFASFLNSCKAIRHSTKAMHRKKPMLGKLFVACKGALAMQEPTRDSARKFFEDHFRPVRIVPPTRTYGFYTGSDGFYTGYYEPQIHGSRFPSHEYKYPLYGVPAKVAGKKSTVFGQFDRKEIVEGALAGQGLEICWVKSPIDAFFAQIQGSTRVKLDTGRTLRLNYVASNGKPYTPVGRILIQDGIISAEEMTMDKIRDYMETNPEKGAELRMKNRSYVFFTERSLELHEEPAGAQGVPLTAGRSIAVDPSIHVYGTPVWIDAKLPLNGEAPTDTFRRLTIAQDTGSAIKGAARADIYFGYGSEVASIAGRIKQFGRFVMLVPNGVAIDKPDPVPVPKTKPAQEAADGDAPAQDAPVQKDSKAAPAQRPKT